MELVNRLTFVLSFVFFLGVTHVRASFESATTFQDCVTALLGEGPLNCQVTRPYTKCAIRTLEILDLLTTDNTIQDFKTGLEQGFEQGGLFCDIDVKSIVDELRTESEENGAVTTANSVTTMKPGFESVRTFKDCNELLLESNQVTCQEVKAFTKCAIRTLDLIDDLQSARTRQIFESSLNQEIRSTGLSCDVDIDVIVLELKEEREGVNTAVTTMSSVITKKPDFLCVDDGFTSNQCAGRANGDYPICDQSKCGVGKYITCSNEILSVRICPLGWYVDDNGNRFQATIVYNPSTGTCEPRSDFCPRGLDKFVEL